MMKDNKIVQQQLIYILRPLRQALEHSWSCHTAYPGTQFEAGIISSKGQCFVSCWFVCRFLSTFPHIKKISIARGVVTSVQNIPIMQNHCWVEISLSCSNNKIIIDLTPDQICGVNDKIIVSYTSEIVRTSRIKYIKNREYDGFINMHWKANTILRCYLLLFNYSCYKLYEWKNIVARSSSKFLKKAEWFGIRNNA